MHKRRSILSCISSIGLLVVLLFANGSPAAARDIFVTPGASGDGSSASPLSSIGEAMALATAGDRVLLGAGDYGDVLLNGEFDAPVLLQSVAGQVPRLRTLRISNARNVHVSGLSISLIHSESYSSATMVRIDASATDIRLSDCDIFSQVDEITAGWGASDWINLPGSGIDVRGDDVAVIGNRLRNVAYGISMSGERALVSQNLIANFSRDGLRGLGDYGIYEYNMVKNAYDVDDHHDDFFQSWTNGPGGVGTEVVRGVVLRGNIFIGYEDPDQPFAGAAQGIGCFDGFFEDWVIENNVVIVNHWHGITLMGARNVQIINNTVVNLTDTDPTPWIRVVAHKNGTPSEDITIANNLSPRVTLDALRSVEDHNLIFSDPDEHFVDRAAFDLRLLETSTAIDSGSDALAPELDRDGASRPHGAAVDIGAYEWGSVPPTMADPDAGTPMADGGVGANTDAGSQPPIPSDSDGGSSDGGSSDGDSSTGEDASMRAWPGADAGTDMSGTMRGTCSVGAPGSTSSTWGMWALGLIIAAARSRRRKQRGKCA